MACEGNGMSDERIGEALIKEVIEEELRVLPSEDVPPMTPYLDVQVQSEQEQKMVTQLAKMIKIVGDQVKNHQEFQDAVDAMVRLPGSKSERFKEMVLKVLQDGISWEKIALLFYIAGKFAVKMVEAHLPQNLREVVLWIVDFYKKNLLSWIQQHGGWINSISELAAAPVRHVSSMGSVSFGLVVFTTGLAIGSLITWRLTRT